MAGRSLLLFLAVWPVLGSAMRLSRRETPSTGFYNVSATGGSWLDIIPNTNGLGEPLNLIVSGLSDYYIATNEAAFLDYMASIGMAEECLGQSNGTKHSANLGDGDGDKVQLGVRRWDYGDYVLGSCKETFLGGNHVRYWHQNGSNANSGAWFMAASQEMSLQESHMIVPDGYDAGRDQVVGNATANGGASKSSWTNRTFETTAQMMPGYLPANSSAGINHGIAIDGLVAVLTVRITSNGSAPALAEDQSAATALSPQLALLATLLALAASIVL